jgi:uncharacterized protein (TIGR03083 family)
VDAELDALHASASRLRELVEPLIPNQVDVPAYPSEWSIGDVMSHIGSGAVIMRKRLEDGLAARDVPDDFAPRVWDEWNAKASKDKAADGLLADDELIVRIDALTPDERAKASFKVGPLTLDVRDLVAMRLNEHTLHTWDIEVARRPEATLAPTSVPLVIDNLELIGRFTARADGGDARAIHVATTQPSRRFTIDIGSDSVTFTAEPVAESDDAVEDLALTAEAFIRLVYGRLDPEHTPAFQSDAGALDRLRAVFPGP